MSMELIQAERSNPNEHHEFKREHARAEHGRGLSDLQELPLQHQ